jgi:hypothetical protein
MRVEKRGEPIQQVMRDTRFLSEEKVALVMASLNGLQHFSDSRIHACDFARVLKSMDDLKLSMPQYDGYVPVAVLDNGCIAIALDDIEKTNDAHNFFSAYPKSSSCWRLVTLCKRSPVVTTPDRGGHAQCDRPG